MARFLMLIGMKRRSGFVTFDNLTAMLVILIIFTSAVVAAETKMRNYETAVNRQILHDKLVAVGSYIVNHQAVNDGNTIYPNWIDERNELDLYYIKNITGLSALEISFSSDNNMECIYRLVVAGSEKEIRKIYICGEL